MPEFTQVVAGGFIVSTQTSGFTIIAWLLIQWVCDFILFPVRLLQETRPGQLWIQFVWPNDATRTGQCTVTSPDPQQDSLAVVLP